jgi:heme-degrading monooxygenase HmoA
MAADISTLGHVMFPYETINCVYAGNVTEKSEEDTSMIAVIFEVWPRPEHKQEYLDIASELRSVLDEIDGFISIERFESLSEPGKILALSFFRDDEAVQLWRNTRAHRIAQTKGRNRIFADYRLRIAEVMRDYSIKQREQVPTDSPSVHD